MAEQERRAGNSRLIYDKATHTIRPERTPADFSREFAGYMADAAADYLQAVNDHAEQQTEASAEAVSDHYRGLASAIYEWRKREERAQMAEHKARSATVQAGKGSE